MALSYVKKYKNMEKSYGRKMEKDAAELPGISREAEEHQLAYVIGAAQEHLVQARKAIREANEDLADLMEAYDAKDKEGLTLWNNATARLKEYKQNMVRLEKARKKPYFGRIDFLAEENNKKKRIISVVLESPGMMRSR